MERAVILGAARMPFGKFGRVLWPLNTSGLSAAEVIIWRRGSGRDLVAVCFGGGQGAVLVQG